MKSDAHLQRDVIAELSWEPSVNATDIGVEVKDGVVTLSGQVESYAEKLGAEHAAQRVAGVKALAVDMDVALPVTSQRLDADIARSAENVVLWSSYLPKDSTQVTVEKGWITLTGEVDWDYQREAAASAVRGLLGVTGVSNQIALKPKLSLSVVKSEIETALKRRAQSDTQSSSVDIKGSDVTLSGTVHSLSARSLARQSAWSTPGVHKVVDNLVVTH